MKYKIHKKTIYFLCYKTYFLPICYYICSEKKVKETVFRKGRKAKKLNEKEDDERTNDSRDASISDSEVSGNGQWRDVSGIDSPVAEKNGNGGCLSLETKSGLVRRAG